MPRTESFVFTDLRKAPKGGQVSRTVVDLATSLFSPILTFEWSKVRRVHIALEIGVT